MDKQNNFFTESLFKPEYFILDKEFKDKDAIFKAIDKVALKTGVSKTAGSVHKALLEREAETSTGLEEGFATPHCRINEIKKSAVFLVRLKHPVEWETFDKKPVTVVLAILVSGADAGAEHLKIISSISLQLLKPDNRNALKTKKDFKSLKNALITTTASSTEKVVSGSEKKPLLVAVTGCIVGIAHTFFASEKLTEAATKLGYTIKVETRGADGISNALTPAEIKEAEAVIIASDVSVDQAPYQGKKLYRCSSKKAIGSAEEVIKAAVKSNVAKAKSDQDGSDIWQVDQRKEGIIKHLLNGVSYMIPVVILGGITLALALGLSRAIFGIDYKVQDHPDTILGALFNIGNISFELMIAVLGGYIAMSIGGKAALAPALVVSFVGNNPKIFSKWITNDIGISASSIAPMGFVGSIIAGFAIGYSVRWMRTWKIPQSIKPIMPLIIIPLICGVIYGLLFIFLLGSIVGLFTHYFEQFVQSAWGSESTTSISVGASLGLLIGAMAGFDVGGPINKTAFLTCVLIIQEGIYTPMGAMGVAIPVAPLGMGMASLIYSKRLSGNLNVAGKGALVLGFVGISEGSIPFILARPKEAVVSNVVSSALAGCAAGAYGISISAPQGGPIMALLGAVGRYGNVGFGNWQALIIALLMMVAFSLVNCFLFGTLITISSKHGDKLKKAAEWTKKLISPLTKKTVIKKDTPVQKFFTNNFSNYSYVCQRPINLAVLS